MCRLTTTVAMNLCNYLASIGANVCYVEANNHNHIEKLPNSYPGMIVREDCIIYNGVKYLSLNARNDEEYNFVVYDMGVIERKTINAIDNKCDVAILCATAKPYEIKKYNKAVKLLDNDKVNTLFSFVQDSEKSKFKREYRNVFFAEYAPDLFDGSINENLFKRILQEYIIEGEIKGGKEQ